jgi:hypothetical protein
MTADDGKQFEIAFGFPPPIALVRLLGGDNLRRSLPIEFRFSHVPFVLQIQYLRNLVDQSNYDVKNKRLAFAVTTDGFDLVVDLTTDELRIMQSEFGGVDYLGITISNLLTAEWSAL